MSNRSHVPAARAVSEGAARKKGAYHYGANDCLHERDVPVAPDLRAELRDKKSLLRKECVKIVIFSLIDV